MKVACFGLRGISILAVTHSVTRLIVTNVTESNHGHHGTERAIFRPILRKLFLRIGHRARPKLCISGTGRCLSLTPFRRSSRLDDAARHFTFIALEGCRKLVKLNLAHADLAPCGAPMSARVEEECLWPNADGDARGRKTNLSVEVDLVT